MCVLVHFCSCMQGDQKGTSTILYSSAFFFEIGSLKWTWNSAGKQQAHPPAFASHWSYRHADSYVWDQTLVCIVSAATTESSFLCLDIFLSVCIL